jgi:hypothetical protein
MSLVFFSLLLIYFFWVFELHKFVFPDARKNNFVFPDARKNNFVFPDARKNNNVYCVKCRCNFFFDKEKINRTVELKSGRIVFELSCPICSCRCYKI